MPWPASVIQLKVLQGWLARRGVPGIVIAVPLEQRKYKVFLLLLPLRALCILCIEKHSYLTSYNLCSAPIYMQIKYVHVLLYKYEHDTDLINKFC